ncbi:MAG: hypothetical protein IKP88_04440 [Lachnospiraceae bacterium]|nr:hypothetical protein [Erysipelotrichaceae bacterium]MBR2544668.1 hypothetical protein [Erysipelotrichaceae bacterium]MBR4341954.1 hypothetical protein [Lachnospiraceae bacterium]
MHDSFNEIIDRLIESGMEEYDAIALVTRMLEEDARNFVFWDDYYNHKDLENGLIS